MSTEAAPEAPAESIQSRKINWPIVAFLAVSPVVAFVSLPLQIALQGFRWTDLIPFIFMYYATGLAITAGYHRYYSHRTFECNRLSQFLFLAFGAATFQNSLVNWASDHRYHHQYSDRTGDPYSVNRGFWWAHMGWMFYAYSEDRKGHNIPDLMKDRLVQWQERNYLALAIITSFVVPTLIGALFGRPWAGFVWGGLVRLVVVQHITFMINSVAHTFGRKTYSTASTARDNRLLAFIGFGEGYHSYHHAHPGDYRIGAKWHHCDPGKWLIGSLAALGFARGLRKARQAG